MTPEEAERILAAASDAEAAAPMGEARSAFNLRYIAASIRANLLLILSIIALFLAGGVIVTMLDTPRYTARATVQINNAAAQVLKGELSEDAESADYDTDRNLKTQLEVLKSRGLAERVVRKLNLASNSGFFASQEVTNLPDSVNAKAREELAVNLVQGNMAVNLPRDSRVATITWNSTDPRFSALVANAYAAEFIQSDLQRKYDSSSYARSFIADQLAETKVRLEQSERALNAYSRQAGLIRARDATTSGDGKSGSGGNSVTTTSLMQLVESANAATAKRIEMEGQWRAINAAPLLSNKEVIANPAIGDLMSGKAKLEAELQELRTRYLEDHPLVKAKREALAATNTQLNALARNMKTGIQAQYLAAVDAERKLGAQVEKLKGDTLSEQDRTVQYALLAREADTNRQVYDGLLERFKQLNAAAGISLSSISIVDEAQVPKGPSSPNLRKNLLAALIAGIALAAATLFFKDQFDDSIRVPEDVEPKLQLPLLGVVPRTSDDDIAVALGDPKSPISEAYNSLRGSLLYSTAGGLPHVILITSAQPSEGKTTSSATIAAGLARMGKSVLLIDADMRRPSLHRRINFDNARGLSTLLATDEHVGSVTQPSGQDKLTYLPSGPIPPSPTELISTPRMEAILQEAARDYDVVIIDSPPILGLADAPTLSALADGVVFIVEANRSRRGSLKMALRRLRAMRPVILGAVLTKFDPLKAGNRYSEYYGYEYYQYSSKDA